MFALQGHAALRSWGMQLSGFLSGGRAGGGICPPLPLGYAESVYESFKMVNYACAQKVPDSTKLHLLKGQKTKFTPGKHALRPP